MAWVPAGSHTLRALLATATPRQSAAICAAACRLSLRCAAACGPASHANGSPASSILEHLWQPRSPALPLSPPATPARRGAAGPADPACGPAGAGGQAQERGGAGGAGAGVRVRRPVQLRRAAAAAAGAHASPGRGQVRAQPGPGRCHRHVGRAGCRPGARLWVGVQGAPWLCDSRHPRVNSGGCSSCVCSAPRADMRSEPQRAARLAVLQAAGSCWHGAATKPPCPRASPAPAVAPGSQGGACRPARTAR